jgi:hypothetical protein
VIKLGFRMIGGPTAASHRGGRGCSTDGGGGGEGEVEGGKRGEEERSRQTT